MSTEAQLERVKPRLKNLKMLDAIHKAVMDHSSNKELADQVWSWLRVDGGKAGVAPPEHYRHLAAQPPRRDQQEWTPFGMSVKCGDQTLFHCSTRPDAEAAADAHNVAIAEIDDALEEK